MSFLSFFYTSKKQASLIVDIGSGSVGGALVLFGSKIPETLSSLRIPIPYSEESPKLLSGMLSIVEEVVNSLIRDSLKFKIKVTNIQCFFSSPWCLTRVHTTYINKAEPVTLTEHFVQDVLRQELKTVSLSQNEIEHNPFFKQPVVVIENVTNKFSLNGYEVKKPYGKKARQVQIVSCVSFVPTDIKNSLEKILDQHVHAHTQILFRSYSYSLYSLIQETIAHESDYMLFDVGAETADIVFSLEGAIYHTDTIYMGRNSLLSAVSKSFVLGPDVALSFINLFTEGHLEESIALRIQTIIDEVEKKWLEELGKVMVRAQKKASFGKIFITADKGVGKIFAQFLVKNRTVASEQDVIILGSETLVSLGLQTKNINDPFLMIEILDIHRYKLFES